MEQQLKVFKIIHLALVFGLIAAYYVLGLFNDLKFPTITSKNYVYLFIPIGAYIISNLLFKKLISKIESNKPLEEKIPQYQSASIVRWAIIEGAAFLISFIYSDFALFGILLIAYLVLLIPTEARIKRDLNLFD